MNNMLPNTFDDNPFDWDEKQVMDFMKSMKVDDKFLEMQKVIRYKGSDYLMFDEDHIFRFYKAVTPQDKEQLMEVRNSIQEKSQKYNSLNLEYSENMVVSQPLNVTGQVRNYAIEESGIVTETKDNTEDSNIEMERSGFIRYNELPYDPFDFDTVLNYEAAKLDYEQYIANCSLYKSYQDFKVKRSQQKKTETQLVLEVKKTQSLTEGSSAIEKFIIKENQTVILGQANCDLSLRDKAVSRKHALIENKNNVCSIQDLGSSCGTFVRIKNQQIPLQQGSIFECGFQEFQITRIQTEGDSAKVSIQIYDGIEQYKGKIFELNIQNRFLIGRDIRCHFGSQFQEDKDLSSYHSKLSIKGNVLSIMDLDSAKGTWLRLSPMKKESAKFQLQNESEFKINPFYITVKINQLGADMFLNSAPSLGNGICITCKILKANLQLLPCQHVACCKNCFQQQNIKNCPRPDCNAPIKQVEQLYNC